MGLFDFLRRDAPDDLARAVLRRLASHGLTGSHDAENGLVLVEGAGPLNLSNLYEHWIRARGSDRTMLVDQLIATLGEEEDDHSWEGCFALLRPLVRPTILNLGDDEPSALPSRALAGALHVYLGVDRPQRVLYVDQTLLDGWGRGFDEAYQIALDNLKRAGGHAFEPVARGVWVSAGQEWNDPAWLLMPDLILKLDIVGDPVAVAVSRNCLVVAGDGDLEALRAMSHFVDEALETQPQVFSGDPIVLKDGDWRPFVE